MDLRKSSELRRLDDELRQQETLMLTSIQSDLREVHREVYENKDKVAQLTTDVSEIKTVLLGNGDPDKSLYVRFDRVEQGSKRANKLVWLLVGAFIAAGVAVIVDRVSFDTGRKSHGMERASDVTGRSVTLRGGDPVRLPQATDQVQVGH